MGDQQEQMQGADANENSLAAASDVTDGVIGQTADQETDSAKGKSAQAKEVQQAGCREETAALGGTLVVAPPSVVKAVWAKDLATKVLHNLRQCLHHFLIP